MINYDVIIIVMIQIEFYLNKCDLMKLNKRKIIIVVFLLRISYKILLF